ncbi:hypothetical protein [Rubrolithibacter danxiaensis]|uniref:glycosyl-4,4'-diaponeurosporenoate acyltransferase CrtO family protein n=1 Tax=Rubrolithibacter danxiaensis TaxID=3390805 RepID=UPI003BF8026A
MKSQEVEKSARIKRIVTTYNQIPVIFWSLLNLIPLGYFCYGYMDLKILYVLLTISILSGFLPHSFFKALQLGKSSTVYNRIGIRIVKKYTQDGDLVNKFVRRKFPEYKVLDSRESLRKPYNKTYFYEKVHFIMFLFFLFASVYALVKGLYVWALLLTVNNLIFNIYPIFLQQYNRIRVNRILGNNK